MRKAVIYGDSISTGNHGNGGYENLLRQSLSIESIVNYAVGSSGLTTKTPNNTTEILKAGGNIPPDAELIIMWHGTNDWYWGSRIGSPESEDTDTLWGGIKNAIKRIRESAPQALFIWAAPIYRLEKPDGGTKTGNAYDTKNAAGCTLLDFQEALERASRLYGFYLVDMRRLTGIHEGNHMEYLEDGVHPNEKGYRIIHRIFHDEITRLLSYGGNGELVLADDLIKNRAGFCFS